MSELIFKDVQPTLSQEQTDYTALSPKTGQQACANCQFFLSTNYVHDYELGTTIPVGPACALVNSHPEPILATGWCKEWRLRKPYEAEPLEVEIVEGDETDEVAPPEAEVIEEKTFKMFVSPKDLTPVQKAVRSVKGDIQPGITLVRKNGKRYMFLISSNGFEDRHAEHVVTRALKEYVEMSEAGTVQKNQHMFWHTIPVGDIIGAGEVDGFLVEISEEAPTRYGKSFFDYFEAHPDDWGASMGFYVRRKDIRIQDGKRTYAHIDKVETSTLPRNAAANLLTLSAIGDDMTTVFEKLTDDIFGAGTHKSMKKGIGKVKQRAESEGMELKQKDAETVAAAADAVAEAETTPPTNASERDGLLLRMIDGLKALITEIEGVATKTEAVTESADETAEEVKSLKKALDDQQKAHAADLAEIREKMKMAPRIASTASETKIIDATEEQKAKDRIAPKEVKLFGGLEVIDAK